MTTINQAEEMVGRKLSKIERIIVEQFGSNDKFKISKDSRGKICANLKDEYRSKDKQA